MKHIFNNILTRLKAEVPELKWIDLDKGQMNFLKPPVVFPCALINIQIPRAENMNSKKQACEAAVMIRVCFDFTGHTHSATPDLERAKSLAYFDIKEKVYTTLQGWGTADMNALSRVNEFEEPRPDAYKVTNITFKTAYHDFTAAP